MTGDGSIDAPLSDHDHWDQLLAGYVLHALEPAEQQDFEVHLHDCAECQREVVQLTALTADLARALPATAPPPGGRERLMAAIHAESTAAPADGPSVVPGPAPTPSGESLQRATADDLADRRARKAGRDGSPRPERRWQFAAAAAALVVIAAGGYGLQQHRAADRRSDQIAAANTVLQGVANGRIVPMEPSDSGGATSARAGVIQHDRKVTFVAQGLQPNDPDASIYVLWASNSQDKMVAVATFDAKAGEIADVVGAPLPSSVAVKPIYAVSLERGRTAPAAPSEAILSTPL